MFDLYEVSKMFEVGLILLQTTFQRKDK